jgi:hypothetical protein
MPAQVIVHNNTGHALNAISCGVLFQITLDNDKIHQGAPWLACAQGFTIPVGASSYPVKVSAIYLECRPGPRTAGHRPCIQGTEPPPLPPGLYRATLAQQGNVVPTPPSITVRITTRSTTP